MVTEIERRATDVLEKLYECHKVDGDSMETVATYLQGEGLDTSYGYTLIDFLDTAGYVTPASTFGGAAGMITTAGIRAVQQLQADRADPKVLAGNLRTAMLLWLDDQEENRLSDPFRGSLSAGEWRAVAAVGERASDVVPSNDR